VQEGVVTAAVLDAPRRAFAEAGSSAPQGGGRMTLEERLQRAWRLLHAQGAAECPVCGSEMTLRAGTGECGGCGAQMT
jgi:ribosomal protein L37AE/L43A